MYFYYLSRLPRALPPAHRRSFVSTVLLSRTWESETVVELRKEAKSRGLSTKGNKSALIARIKEHEQNSSPPIHTPNTSRSVSTNVLQSSAQKTSQADSPGIPLPARPASSNSDFLAIKLPNLSRPAPIFPVQVPYVPDFWNSAAPKANAPVEPTLPKLYVVSGSATHYDGGPTYNLEKLQEGHSPPAAVRADFPPPLSKEFGLWAEFWESVGLPRTFSVRRALSEARDSAVRAEKDESWTRSRPLTDEERKGLYVLFGIIGGSWLVGELMNRPTVVAERHVTQNH